MQSVDQESSSTTSTCASAPSARTLSAIASRITSSAGQPRNVGVNSTRTLSPSTCTFLTTPRSTSEITGISGSGISASASQTCAAVTTSPPARCAAPSSSPPTTNAARRSGCLAPQAPSRTWSRDNVLEGRAQLLGEDADGVGPELCDGVLEARLVLQPV